MVARKSHPRTFQITPPLAYRGVELPYEGKRKVNEMDYKQEELFDMSRIPTEEKAKPRKYWYYVTTPRNRDMVYGVDRDGLPLFCEHDTRQITGVLPHLFNTQSEAHRFRDKYVNGGHVKKWLYSRT